MAQLLDIEEGDTVNYRVVVIRTTEPLIYAISLIPVTRLENNFKEDHRCRYSNRKNTQKTQH